MNYHHRSNKQFNMRPGIWPIYYLGREKVGLIILPVNNGTQVCFSNATVSFLVFSSIRYSINTSVYKIEDGTRRRRRLVP